MKRSVLHHLKTPPRAKAINGSISLCSRAWYIITVVKDSTIHADVCEVLFHMITMRKQMHTQWHLTAVAIMLAVIYGGSAPHSIQCAPAKSQRGTQKTTATARSPNLVKNGGFELGKHTPLGWTEVNGLTTFWEKDAKTGNRYIRFDTDVYRDEARARAREMQLPHDKRPPPKPKTPPTGNKYNTVAGTDGVSLTSDWIEVKPNGTYRISARVKSTGTAIKVFVKGYGIIRGKRELVYQASKNFKKGDGKWHTIERIVHLSKSRIPVRWVRIVLFAYWPPGQVWFDDISFTRVRE